MTDLDGRVILVNGGADGIAAASCDVLAGAGARLVIGDFAKDAGQAIAEAICARGCEAILVQAGL